MADCPEHDMPYGCPAHLRRYPFCKAPSAPIRRPAPAASPDPQPERRWVCMAPPVACSGKRTDCLGLTGCGPAPAPVEPGEVPLSVADSDDPSPWAAPAPVEPEQEGDAGRFAVAMIGGRALVFTQNGGQQVGSVEVGDLAVEFCAWMNGRERPGGTDRCGSAFTIRPELCNRPKGHEGAHDSRCPAAASSPGVERPGENDLSVDIEREALRKALDMRLSHPDRDRYIASHARGLLLALDADRPPPVEGSDQATRNTDGTNR